MKIYKVFAVSFLFFNISLTILFAQKKMENSVKSEDLNVLKEGAYSNVDVPFIFVARDPEMYAKLQTLVDDLPVVSKIDFSKSAVIAGFGGEKSKGGYRINFQKTEGEYILEIKSPGKDVMTTQVITTPFKVVQISLNENEGLPIKLSGDFSGNVQNFKLEKNSFGFSGGFAGIQKNFIATGTIGVLSYQDFVTIDFDLKAEEGNRKLFETASGTLKDGVISLARLDAGTFCDNPHTPFAVKGLLKEKGLTLNFAGLPNYIADGYQPHGSLVAKKIER